MITRDTLEDSPPWTPIKGRVFNPGPIIWALFDPGDASDELVDKLSELGYRFTDSIRGHHPEVVDEDNPKDLFDDLDAALAYLQAGGTLIKVPRNGSYRCYAVKRLRRRAKKARK